MDLLADRPPGYADAVPSVVRALDVIEHLARATSGRTLSQLSRALSISPSSLLAILRTLSSRGYIEHDSSNGQYRLGTAFAQLAGENASNTLIRVAAEAVTALAQATATATGQGASTDHQQAARSALGMASRQLAELLLGPRAAKSPPADITVSRLDDWAGAAGDTVASGPHPTPLPKGDKILREPVWRSEASGPLGPTELGRFLNGAWVATLSCVKENGYPYSVPVWYHWDGRRFWVVPRVGAEWAHYLERNPCVSLAISEPQPPLQRVLVEGRAEPLTEGDTQERIREMTALLAARYLGSAAGPYLEATAAQSRRAFSIFPEKLVTWHGLASHPRYQ
ncbi:MAG TPA: pyridoxamine 5'-phosphate oxidase family protein, partial [Chloroflexota bacterium]|nr:pyridoxamine 5'-phosphate oxidase family protein [Chloroflexota bacterium]